jgi:hypothetical protein
MKKSSYFDSREMDSWPEAKALKPYFFAPPGQEWFHTGGNDGASIDAEGIDGTGGLPANAGRIDLRLLMWGIPSLGVLLIYSKWGARPIVRKAIRAGCASGFAICTIRLCRWACSSHSRRHGWP